GGRRARVDHPKARQGRPQVNIPGFAAKNLLRNKFRTFLTVAGVSVAVVAFVLLRTVIWAWTAGAEDTSIERVFTRHKVTFVMILPKRYVDEVKNLKDAKGRNPVRCVTWANWFGGKDPAHEGEFFATIAVDEQTYLDVYDDIK